MKQTAVEWYEKEINSLLEKYESKEISTLDFIIIKHNLFDTAKEMEIEQQGYSEEEVEDLIYKVCGTVARLQGIILNGNYIHSAYKQYKKK